MNNRKTRLKTNIYNLSLAGLSKIDVAPGKV
jgi:hypothetical protein